MVFDIARSFLQWKMRVLICPTYCDNLVGALRFFFFSQIMFKMIFSFYFFIIFVKFVRCFFLEYLQKKGLDDCRTSE